MKAEFAIFAYVYLRQVYRETFKNNLTPIVLTEATTDPDTAAAKRAFKAMMQMKKIDIAAIEAARRG